MTERKPTMQCPYCRTVLDALNDDVMAHIRECQEEMKDREWESGVKVDSPWVPDADDDTWSSFGDHPSVMREENNG